MSNIDITRKILKERVKLWEKYELQKKNGKNSYFENYKFFKPYESDDENKSFISVKSTNSDNTLINKNSNRTENGNENIKNFHFNNKNINNTSESEESDIFSDSSESELSFISNNSIKNIKSYNSVIDSDNNINLDSDNVFEISSPEYYKFKNYNNLYGESNESIIDNKYNSKIMEEDKSFNSTDTYFDEEPDELILLNDFFNFTTSKPEFIIKIEKKVVLSAETNDRLDGFNIKVQQLVDTVYIDLVNQFITPFMNNIELSHMSNLKEILEDINAEITIQNDSEPSTSNNNDGISSSNEFIKKDEEEHIKKIKTEISRGFCLTIPELGYLIISHSGDIIVNNETKLESLRIISPSHVIIKKVTSKILEIESTSLSFMDNQSFNIDKLEFKGNQNDPLLSMILCGLIINEKTNLTINNLIIKEGLLLNYGHLTVNQKMKLNEGYIFNIGTINLNANNPIITNIQFMYNGFNGDIISKEYVVFGIDKFINYGNVKIKRIGFASTVSFLNKGTIETKECFELNLLGNGLNNGFINGSSGEIIIKGNDFKHVDGKIAVSKLYFQNLKTELNSVLVGQEMHCQGEVMVSGKVQFQYGIIEGYFFNASKNINFENKLELRGNRSVIINESIVNTNLIVSNATIGIINRGLFTTKSIKVESNKHIQLQCIMPFLEKVETDLSSKLYILSDSSTPKLKYIKNSGDISICSNLSELCHIENSNEGNIYLESKEAFHNINQLDDIHGNISIKGSLPKITHLHLKNGAFLTLLENSDLTSVDDIVLTEKSCLLIKSNVNISKLNSIKVNSESECIIEKNVVAKNINTIYNKGYISCAIPLLNLNALINGINSNFFFLEKAIIKGRNVNDNDINEINDRCIIDCLKNEHQNQIAMYNEGNIYVDISSSHINISGDYIGTENSIFRLEKGFISIMNKFINKGIVYSPELLHYNIGLTTTISNENGKSISDFLNNQNSINYKFFNPDSEFQDHSIRLGQNVAENGIIFTLECKNSKIDKTFEPIINGENKELVIISKFDIDFNSNIEWNADLVMKIPNYDGKQDLKLRSLSLETGSFSNRNKISTQHGTLINADTFKNESGRIESTDNIIINVQNKFENTGGGSLKKNVPEHIQYYTCVAKKESHNIGFWRSSLKHYKVSTKIEKHNTVIYRDIYDVQLHKAGVITSGKNLIVNSNSFDNSFGILNASKGLNINSSSEVKNECGLMYSGKETHLQGRSLNNGYKKNSTKFEGVDINKPIREKLPVLYQVWVQSGYWKRDSNFFKGLVGREEWRDTSHYENRIRHENLITGYKPLDTYSTSSEYPGYIFSKGDISINVEGNPSYLGTIVSGENIDFKGSTQSISSLSDRGLIIAKGDVKMQMKNALNQQLAIQANNIFINLTEDLVIQGIVKPMIISNNNGENEVIQIVNLKELANWMGFISNKNNFLKTNNIQLNNPTPLISLSKEDWEDEFVAYRTSEAGFLRGVPSVDYFMPTLQEKKLNDLLQFVLTPIYGREILFNENLKNELMQRGAMIADSLISKKLLLLPNKIVDANLPGKNPVLLYDKSQYPDTEIEINGGKKKVPLYDPCLITNTISQIVNKIIAQKKMKIKTKGNIDFRPGKINIEAKKISVEAEKKIRFLGEYKYGGNNYNRTGVEKVNLNFKDFEVSGKEGIFFQGANISANNFIRKTEKGDIKEKSMPLDQHVNFIDSKTVSVSQDAVTSTFIANESIQSVALNGNIIQEGTNMRAKNVSFESKKHTWSPVYQNQFNYVHNSKGYAKSELSAPKTGGMYSNGTIIFKSKDTSLKGIQIFSKKVSNPVDGKFSILPSYTYQKNESHYKTYSLFGSASRHVKETREMVNPSIIMTDHFETKGKGLCEFESVILKAVKATIDKDFIEKTAYDKIHTYIHESSSGFFAPKIKNDPIFDALKNVKSVINLGDSATLGDILPTTFTTVGTVAKAITDIKTMANLDMFEDPFTQVAKVILSRYVSNIGFSSNEMTMERDEIRPRQSKIDVEVLHINNKKTHLEGNYTIKEKGVIDTDDFITASPRHVIDQRMEASGWSISLSTVGIALASYGLGSTVAACLPSINAYESDSNYHSSKPVPMSMKANELVIRCNNAVFKGSKIRSRLLEMIVNENLTIESLIHEFQSESHSSSFGIDLGAIYNVMNPNIPSKGAPVPGMENSVFHKLSAIPSLRSVDEKTVSKKINYLAELVGEEAFYLTVGKVLHNKGALVGLLPDGVAVKRIDNDNEHIEASKIINENIKEYENHERQVFNPSLNEFFGMMSQIDDCIKFQERINIYNMIKEEKQQGERVKEFLKRKDIIKLLNEKEKYLAILKALRLNEKQIKEIFKNNNKKDKSMEENFEEQKNMIRKQAINVYNLLEKEINKFVSENSLNDNIKAVLMSTLHQLNIEIMNSSIETIVKKISYYKNINEKKLKESNLNENKVQHNENIDIKEKKPINNNNIDVKVKKPINSNEYKKGEKLINDNITDIKGKNTYINGNKTGINNVKNSPKILNNKNNTINNSKHSTDSNNFNKTNNNLNTPSTSSPNSSEKRRIPTTEEECSVINKCFNAIINNPKLAASIAYDEIKDSINNLINDKSIQAVFKHLDMVPGAIVDCIIDEIVDVINFAKDCINNYELIPDLISEIYYDYMKNGRIEGTLRIISDLLSVSSKGLSLKKGISKFNKIKFKKLKANTNNPLNKHHYKPINDNSINKSSYKPINDNSINKSSYKPVNDNSIDKSNHKPINDNSINKHHYKPTNDNSINKSYNKPVNDNSINKSYNKPINDNSINKSYYKPVNDNSINKSNHKLINDNSINNSNYKPVNDNSINKSYYKPSNDNGDTGNLIFLDNLPKNTPKEFSTKSLLNETSFKPVNNNKVPLHNTKVGHKPDVPECFTDLLLQPKYANDIIHKPELFFNIKSRTGCLIDIIQNSNLTDIGREKQSYFNHNTEKKLDVKGKKPMEDEDFYTNKTMDYFTGYSYD